MSLEKEVLSQLGEEEQEILRKIFRDDPIADANNDAVNVENGSRQRGC